jgi:GTP-binding protein
LKVLSVELVTSAPNARGIPDEAVPQIALVGRSNVGKSTLINALTRKKVARTSAAPGKTRLANVYRVQMAAAAPGALRTLYFVDLPGYGYARGGPAAAEEFALTADYFGQVGRIAGVIQAVDGRHPGLASDLAARDWALGLDMPAIVVTTKVDRMSRAERDRARREFETTLKCQVLPVSAVTGEGLDDLWKQISKLASSLPPRDRTEHR